MTDRLADLADAGVSIWLDDLSRERLQSGNLAELIATSHVVGVTTNPTIFAGALAHGEAYAPQIRQLKADGASVEKVIETLTTDDVRAACDLFEPIFEESQGFDGRVSIEVDPRLAHDTQQTITQALELYSLVDRKNVMIKVPATPEGLPAITAIIAEGISVNVTLIFSVDRYAEVIDAYQEGLGLAAEKGIDLSTIHSVASFFISRVDTEIDKRLDAIGTDEAFALKGKAALANAHLAYDLFWEEFSGQTGWEELVQETGAHEQRPLWASTGVKDPALPDTLYVAELAHPDCVNTMPEKTLQAFADHGELAEGDFSSYLTRTEVLDQLEALGIDIDDVCADLEAEGVAKFIASWGELMETVQQALDAA